MNSSVKDMTRRRLLRGLLGGGAVAVGLPILDCVLNDNGDAFAAGAPLPTRFGTWFWPCGLGERDWRPKVAGKDYDLPQEMEALKPFKDKVNLFSGSQIFLDGVANQTHFTGVQGYMTGRVTSSGEYFSSIDGIIAEQIGKRSRFKSLVAVVDGDPKASWTAFASGKVPAEPSPVALYKRIFGPGYTDPNAAHFTPDPEAMASKSVLSAISDERATLNRNLGATDKQKLDYYFTALRSLEQQLEIQLQKPTPLPSCTMSTEPRDDGEALSIVEQAMVRHDLLCGLMTHAIACDQTRVVNLAMSQGMTKFRRDGDAVPHHSYTHTEPVDLSLGYQVKCAWFQSVYFDHLAKYVAMLDSVKEGDKSLLDRMSLFAFTCHGMPRLHSVLNYPFIAIGGANGKMNTGMHLASLGDTAARVTYTLLQAYGVQVSNWGTGSNRVASPIAGVLA